MRNEGGCKHFFFFEIFCELLQPLWKISQTVVRGSIDVLLVISVWSFLVNRTNFLVRVRHFALFLDLKMYLTESCGGDVEDEPVSELKTIQGL